MKNVLFLFTTPNFQIFKWTNGQSPSNFSVYMKYLIITFVNFTLSSQLSFAQTLDYNSADSTILKTIASLTGRFILQTPIKNSYSLSPSLSSLDEEYSAEEINELKLKFPCLNENLTMDKNTIDTFAWTRKDFPSKILIKDYTTLIKIKNLVLEYELVPTKSLKDTIKKMNNDICFLKQIVTKISKPVFNLQRSICAIDIIQLDTCNNGPRLDSTYFFYKDNGQWILCSYLYKGENVNQ